MADKQVLTVIGATGKQGGSVVNTFLADLELKSKWAIRGVTRDPSKDSAKKLAERGVEVVAGDLDDRASLVNALEGSHTVFAVTDYWAHLDRDRETVQGKNIADAAKATDVKHLIWSTLKNCNKLTNGRLPNIYHFDHKALVSEYILSLGLPATFYLAGLYMSNFTGGMLMNRNPQTGGFVLPLPVPLSAPMPLVDIYADTGKFVRGIVKAGPTGNEVLGSSGYRTFGDFVEAFKKIYPEEGAKLQYLELSNDDFKNVLITDAGFPDYVAQEMLENLLLLNDVGYYGGDSLDASIALAGGKDGLTTLEEHLKNAPEFRDLK